MIRITVTDSKNNEKVLHFRADSITVGRSPESNVQVVDESVSKNHGRLTVAAGGIFYEDLDSTNGSIIRRDGRDTRLHHCPGRRHAIKPGAVIQLGKFRIQLAPEAPAVADANDDAPLTLAVSRPPEAPPTPRPARRRALRSARRAGLPPGLPGLARLARPGEHGFGARPAEGEPV